MHLHGYSVKNFRRLSDVHIDLAKDISIFVGTNNSGKTSATQVISAFASGKKEWFSIYDFSSECWTQFDAIGAETRDEEAPPHVPAIALDLWFTVSASDLYLVVPLLPSTDWEGTQVGLRIEFAARDPEQLLENFRTAQQQAKSSAEGLEVKEGDQYVPWPASMTDYLKRELKNEFAFRYFVLDRAQFGEDFEPLEEYKPLELARDANGAAILRSLIKVDSLSAQRHLSDAGVTSEGRAEDLSKRLSRFYKRNLDQRQDDHQALRALFESEAGLNKHLSDVFQATLERLSDLGYPGLHNPRLEIKSALNPASIMSSQDARVHYVLGDQAEAPTLPDSYNGLGFKNLIYMVVEILDLHAKWAAEEENRAPLHLVFIEEPETHLHAQLQQVFIRQVLSLMDDENSDDDAFSSQTVVTTHSPHVLYERGFTPVRYFKRHGKDDIQSTKVINLSRFYDQNVKDRDFLQRYLKLTHCDLFFADAAILVEGNVERLLMPVMVEREAESLKSACVSILEVGGAFAHRFKDLVEFLGLTTLVITDIDSVMHVDAENADEDETVEFEVPDDEGSSAAESDSEESPKTKNGKKCLPSEPNALTSNQSLIKWLPKKQSVEDLFNAEEHEKIAEADEETGFKVRVAYQTRTDVTWNEETASLCGRTLEEAFGLENPDLFQQVDKRHLGLKLRTTATSPQELAIGLHKRVSGRSFDKTKFALGILTEDPDSWKVPAYIAEGLKWLEAMIGRELPVSPARPESDTPPDPPPSGE